MTPIMVGEEASRRLVQMGRQSDGLRRDLLDEPSSPNVRSWPQRLEHPLLQERFAFVVDAFATDQVARSSAM